MKNFSPGTVWKTTLLTAFKPINGDKKFVFLRKDHLLLYVGLLGNNERIFLTKNGNIVTGKWGSVTDLVLYAE